MIADRIRDDVLQAEIKASAHTFRHCCATHLLRGGASLRFVLEDHSLQKCPKGTRYEDEKEEILTIYISNPQVWNRYTYTLNDPLKYIDPEGKRPLTRQEEQDIERLRQQAQGKSADDARAINSAADAIVGAIQFSSYTTKRSTRFGNRIKAFHQIGNQRYG